MQHIRKICEELNISSKVRILGAKKANKRLQMIQGLKEVRTPITVFADDDVFWPTTFLVYLLAAFEDPESWSSRYLHEARTSFKPQSVGLPRGLLPGTLELRHRGNLTCRRRYLLPVRSYCRYTH